MASLDDKRFLRQVGQRIREKRVALEMTQAELAMKCRLHRTFIGSCERGERNLSMLSLTRIAKALDVHVVEFLTNSPPG